jgi:hypothetical protein
LKVVEKGSRSLYWLLELLHELSSEGEATQSFIVCLISLKPRIITTIIQRGRKGEREDANFIGLVCFIHEKGYYYNERSG